LVILALSAAVVLVACEKGNDAGVIDSLSEEERRDVEAKLEEAQDSVQFTLLFPNYLPEEFDPIPLTGLPPDGQIVTLIFEREDGSTQGGDLPLFIKIDEYSGSADDLSCETLNLIDPYLDPEHSCTDVSIAGSPGVSELQALGPDTISHTARRIIDGRQITVDVNWAGQTTQGTLPALTDEKIQVAFDILTSLRHLD
jgi:hypothetical protein